MKVRALYTNPCGTNISPGIATLHFTPEPSITTQPADQLVCIGENATYSVTTDSLSLPIFQWQLSTNNGKSFTDISSATNRDYTVMNVDSSSNGNQYRAIASNRCATATSGTAILNVKPSNTKITTQPFSRNVCEGDLVSFSIIAQNVLRYQWRKNGINIPAETLSVFNINKAVPSDSAMYSVIVFGDCGLIASNNALLNVGTATKILQQPLPQTADENKSATFTVNAAGLNLTYQWMKDGVPISGATGSIFTIQSVKKSDEGNYSVKIQGSCGNPVTSNVARLNVIVSSVDDAAIPAQPILYQNYPNPFTQSTTITLTRPSVTHSHWETAGVRVYDIFGREVLDLSEQARNNSTIKIYTSQLPCPGIYFYRLTIGNQSQTKMMVLR